MSEHIEIPIDDVMPGMFIEFKLNWLKHPFYSNSFRVNSAKEIFTLKDCGVSKVKYFPERSSVSYTKPATNSVKQHVGPSPSSLSIADDTLEDKKIQLKKLQEQQKKLGVLEREYKLVFNRISNIVHVLQSDPQTGVKGVQDFLSATIDFLISEMESLVNIVSPKISKKHVDSIHLLNVCYLCLILGKSMGLSRMQLYELGTAAFLHDIGKTKIPRKILLKRPPYTKIEKQFIELHPKYGIDMLANINSISKNVIEGIYQHHENCNGTGYPQKKTSRGILPLAKIISVVNTYDNLCNYYHLNRLLTPHESLSYMYTRLKDELSSNIVKIFIKRIGVYPPGCLVELSDGNLGMVVETSQANSTRPTIVIYDQTTPREKPIIVNLSEVKDLSIERSIRPAEAPEEVVLYLQKGNNHGCLYIGSFVS